MALFDSGVPLANVALSDTFNTWRVRTNQINTQAAGLASNNVFSGATNNFGGILTATTLNATTANFTTLQSDSIDFDGDLTVDKITANSAVLAGPITAPIITANTVNGTAANFTTLQADSIDFDGDLTVDTVTANSVVASASANLGAVGNVTITGGSNGQALTTDGSGNLSFSTISSTTDLTSDVTGVLPIANGGTGLSALGSASQVIAVNGAGNALEFTAAASGTVTSVQMSSSLSGISFSGGPITSSGTITASGTLGISNGGTGATSASSARTQLSLGTSDHVQFHCLGVGTAASTNGGEIRATNNITAYYSDDRLKTRLGNIEGALDKVNTLTGFYYEANETAQELGYDPVREVGVSAQDVQAVLPEIVVPAPIDENYLTIRYEKLVPLLVEAIKELSDKVAMLEGK